MNRRAFLSTVPLAILAAPLAAEAHQVGKVYRIGTVDPVGDAVANRLFAVFRQQMAALGYIEDKNVQFEYRSSTGRDERLPDLVAELVRLKVDV